MSTPRFHVPGAIPDPTAGPAVPVPGSTVLLPAEADHHARRVLRLRPGDAVVIFDGRGNEYAAILAEAPGDGPANASRYAARILSGGAVDRDAGVAITLIQALSATDKIDWLLEKCVELGVARLVLAPAERSVVRLDAARGARRLERWHDMVVNASCQCGRNRLMEVTLAGDLAAALQGKPHADGRGWILDPAAPLPLALALAATAPAGPAAAGSVAIAVGPEGGFTAAELGLAESLGYARARLGPRVLRTETAGLVAVTAVLALSGEYGA